MPYTKVHEDWEDLPSTDTPITAAALEQIEQGIADAQDDADSALSSIGDHLSDTSAAHAASAVSFSPAGTVGATNVQSAIAEVASDAAADVTAHTSDSSGAHAASAISFTPTGSVSSSNVQAAIAEVAAEVSSAGGTVDSVVAGNGIDVDDTDPGNPVVAVESAITDKLDGIEAGADVTDATNVAAAGAVMESDTSTASMSFVVDEDDMASDSATKVPTQQSVKAYVDAQAPITPDAVACKVTRTEAFTLTTSGTTYTIPWDTETFDSDGFHDNTENNTRLTVPTGLDGLYLVGATLGMVAFTGTNQRFLGWLSLNGSTTIDYMEIGGDGNTQIPFVSLSTIVSLQAGDYIEAKVIQTTGVSRGFTTSPSNLRMVRLGPNP